MLIKCPYKGIKLLPVILISWVYSTWVREGQLKIDYDVVCKEEEK